MNTARLVSLSWVSLLAALSITAHAQQDVVLLQTLKQERLNLQLRQTAELGVYLKKQHALAVQRGDLSSVNAIQSRIDNAAKHYADLQAGTNGMRIDMDNKRFIERLKGRSWQMQGNSPPFHASFMGDKVYWRDSAGVTKHTLDYQIIWPGLLRVTSGKSVFLYFFDADLNNLAALATVAEFPGKPGSKAR